MCAWFLGPFSDLMELGGETIHRRHERAMSFESYFLKELEQSKCPCAQEKEVVSKEAVREETPKHRHQRSMSFESCLQGDEEGEISESAQIPQDPSTQEAERQEEAATSLGARLRVLAAEALGHGQDYWRAFLRRRRNRERMQRHPDWFLIHTANRFGEPRKKCPAVTGMKRHRKGYLVATRDSCLSRIKEESEEREMTTPIAANATAVENVQATDSALEEGGPVVEEEATVVKGEDQGENPSVATAAQRRMKLAF